MAAFCTAFVLYPRPTMAAFCTADYLMTWVMHYCTFLFLLCVVVMNIIQKKIEKVFTVVDLEHL
jgi:uncharacterized PurR-regulated membrane protein YhhQ (DUF165 family)